MAGMGRVLLTMALVTLGCSLAVGYYKNDN